MEAASTQQLADLLSKLDSGAGVAAKHAAQTAAFVAVKLRHSGCSLDEVHRLSAEFLEDRRRSMRGVLGAHGLSMPDVDFVFAPIVPSCAATFIDSDRTTILLSLGLVEALRLAVASAQLESTIGRLVQDPALIASLKVEWRSNTIILLRAMTQYFNASAVLHFKEPGRLPGAANLLDPATKHRVDVVLEAVMLFLLLHEMGHVDHRRRLNAHNVLPKLTWEFAVPEDQNSAKEEEFYADQFALNAVPDAFALPLAHAATFFLHLHNYVDYTSAGRPTTHPLCVNRIATLFAAAARKSSPDAVGTAALNQAIEAGTGVWMQPGNGFSVDALRSYVTSLGRTDWRPAQEALQVLAQRDVGGE